MSKTIIILGAGAGISQSVAKTFGKQGFSIALVSRNAGKLEQYIDELMREGINAKAFSGDVSNEESLKNAIDEIKITFKKNRCCALQCCCCSDGKYFK